MSDFDPDKFLEERRRARAESFDPDKFLEERRRARAESFDPDKFLEERRRARDNGQTSPSQTESFIKGAAQGATLGFADEITAGAKTAIEKLSSSKSMSDIYKEKVDIERQKYKEAELTNPKSYIAGEIGGGLSTLAIPAVGPFKTMGLAAKAATVGAVQGVGTSDQDKLSARTVTDAIIGGAVGGALGYGASKIGKAASSTGKIFSEALNNANKDLILKNIVTKEQASALTKSLTEQQKTALKDAAKAASSATKAAVSAGTRVGAVYGIEQVASSIGLPGLGYIGAAGFSKQISKTPASLAKKALIDASAAKEAAKIALQLQLEKPSTNKAANKIVEMVRKATTSASAKKLPKVDIKETNVIQGDQISPTEIFHSITDPKTGKEIGRAIVWKADPKATSLLGQQGASLKDIRINKEYRGNKLGEMAVSELAEKYGLLASDTRGNLSPLGKSLMKKMGTEQKDGSFVITNMDKPTFK